MLWQSDWFQGLFFTLIKYNLSSFFRFLISLERKKYYQKDHQIHPGIQTMSSGIQLSHQFFSESQSTHLLENPCHTKPKTDT